MGRLVNWQRLEYFYALLFLQSFSRFDNLCTRGP